MAQWFDNLINLFSKGISTPHQPAGFFSYQSPANQAPSFRLHLRLEGDGTGLLIINAHTTLHLNQTAAEYAYSFIQGRSPQETALDMSQRYRVTIEQSQADYEDLLDKVMLLSTSEDIDPVTYLGIERMEPYPPTLSAPYRLDCALTYRTSNVQPDEAPSQRVKRELLTDEWKLILDRSWQAGIPHVLFTGGEPTTRPDLDELLTHAQYLGMVTGLLTDGLRLSEHDYLQGLLLSGLDHIMILLEDRKENSWEAIRDVLAEDIFLTVHLTLKSTNTGRSQEILHRLQKMGVQNLSITAATPAENQAVKDLASIAASSGMKLVWDVPVPYSIFNPYQLEREEEHLTEGAGKGWLYVEPDGDVLPAQGVTMVMGNLLTDEWPVIWKNRPAV
jgi:organic radical activating enzyme